MNSLVAGYLRERLRALSLTFAERVLDAIRGASLYELRGVCEAAAAKRPRGTRAVEPAVPRKSPRAVRAAKSARKSAQAGGAGSKERARSAVKRKPKRTPQTRAVRRQPIASRGRLDTSPGDETTKLEPVASPGQEIPGQHGVASSPDQGAADESPPEGEDRSPSPKPEG